MIDLENKKTLYQALINKDKSYDGLLFVGVKSTSVFCRPTCAARKPKFESCEFFEKAQQALLAGFRPCKRCQPLSHPDLVPKTVQILIDAIEKNPEKRWQDQDFRTIAIDVSTARRQFKKRFGITFVQYARARRMGIALKQITAGAPIIDAQISTGYESSSGFRDAFKKMLGAAPSLSNKHKPVLYSCLLDTQLGPMIGISNQERLILLEFTDRRGLEREIERLIAKTKSVIIPGHTSPLKSIQAELNAYFNGELQDFKTPILLLGSHFQQTIWAELQKIPLGETRSYADIALSIQKPSAYRAVAQANGANQLSLIIPCHRIINSNSTLGGYGGGIKRKQWLLDHENKIGKKYSSN